jgi:hypothetical protein
VQRTVNLVAFCSDLRQAEGVEDGGDGQRSFGCQCTSPWRSTISAQDDSVCGSNIQLMFTIASRISTLKTIVLGGALLAYPGALLAQRGAGGGHTGGGTAGGEGLGSIGKPSGVDVKDDLKDFREVLAVQATTQQIVEFAAMIKSTEAATAELKMFPGQAGKEGSGSELAGRGATIGQAIEKARSENRKFLDGFSERQKSGLKEIIKRLIRADSDLAQQTRAFDLQLGDAKAVGPAIASPAQSLARALTSFQTVQRNLGEEMSIGTSGNSQASAFNLAPVKDSVRFGDHAIAITTSGVVSQGVEENGQDSFKLELTTDISELQQNIAAVLRAQLEKADRCGERIEIHDASLTPREPASLVVVQLHFERWACFGRNTVNEMVEGGGTVEVKLTPSIGADGGLRLTPEMGRVDAGGTVGELLRSGSLGETLRDRIADTVLSTVRQGADFKATLPLAAQGHATLRRAQFEGTGSGRLMAVLDGEIRVSKEQVVGLTSELKERSSSQASSQAASQESTPATVPH